MTTVLFGVLAVSTASCSAPNAQTAVPVQGRTISSGGGGGGNSVVDCSGNLVFLGGTSGTSGGGSLKLGGNLTPAAGFASAHGTVTYTRPVQFSDVSSNYLDVNISNTGLPCGTLIGVWANGVAVGVMGVLPSSSAKFPSGWDFQSADNLGSHSAIFLGAGARIEIHIDAELPTSSPNVTTPSPGTLIASETL